ncbi:hypothetical protein F4823DRAFT_637371 [Ustulina deusta]|nr:hypothetical protein F4823DRAFT_637371 [Ustulina deusta]
MAQDYEQPPEIESGIACSRKHLTISYDRGFLTTIIIPPPPKTTPLTATPPYARVAPRYAGAVTSTVSPVDYADTDDDDDDDDAEVSGEDGEAEIQRHHHHFHYRHRHHPLRTDKFYCTSVTRNENWGTHLPVPSWLPKTGLLTAKLNTYITLTELTTTATEYWNDVGSLHPPNYPATTGRLSSLAIADEAEETSEEGQGNSGFKAHAISLSITKCSTVSTAVVTVTITETVTERKDTLGSMS